MKTGPTPISEQDEARSSIRDLVRRQGARLKAATPTGMVAALVASACMPVAWPLLSGVPESARAAIALLGAAGGGYISDSLKEVIERLRRKSGPPATKGELQQALEQELLTCLRNETAQSAALRTEAAFLLERVQAVETALGAASADVQLALTSAFIQLGDGFGEFRWMLREAFGSLDTIEGEQARQGAEQRHQTELLREFRIKINLALRRLETLATQGPGPATFEPPEGGEEQAPAPGPCPYKGLGAFQAEDAEWFFGRDRLVAELTIRLSESSFLAVLGPSGSGKSSLLRAGLLPAVWSGKLPGERAWATITMTPGTHPLEELAARVGVESGVAAGLLLEDWGADPWRVGLALRQVLAKAPTGTRLLLLIDQFEEVFTLCSSEAERRAFIRGLAAAIGDSDTRASIVLGVRADFYARCVEYPELVEAMRDRQVLVGPMSPDDVREAIVGPAARAGLALEPGLVETVLADLGDEPGFLPLMSHALFATWQRRRGRMLTIAGYREAGGVRQSIGWTAERTFARFDAIQQGIARDIFLRLTALGEGTEDTRRRVRRRELVVGRDVQAVEEVLERLAEARLVILDDESVEVSHEALIREWPTLRGWLAEDREGLRIHRRLTQAATEWEALGCEPGALYRGGLLASARDWAGGQQARLNDLERAFLAASSKRERDELAAARRRNRRLAALSAILIVALVVAVWQTGSADRQRQIARNQTLAAERQRRIATGRALQAEAENLRGIQPQTSLQLSLAALRLDPTPQGRAGLVTTIMETHYAGSSEPTTTGIRVDDTDAFSPDGRTLATAGGDNTVVLWDISDPAKQHRLASLTGHTEAVKDVAFSPDERTLATVSSTSVILWDLADRSQPQRVATLNGIAGVAGAAFSPDGRTLATVSWDNQNSVGALTLWDIGNRATPRQVSVQMDVYDSSTVAFDPDGRTIVTATSRITGTEDLNRNEIAVTQGSGTTVWDVSDRSHPRDLQRLRGQQWAGAFSPDGHLLATIGLGNSANLWDITDPGNPKELAVLTGHTQSLLTAAISPDGRTLATASYDQSVMLWDVTNPTNPTRLATLTGHTSTPRALRFSSDGQTLTTAYDDGSVIRWRVASRTQPAPVATLADQKGPMQAVAFSPDSRTLATASFDKTVMLWDITNPTNPTRLATLTGHAGPVEDIDFSSDGTILASAGGDTIILWDVTDRLHPRQVATLPDCKAVSSVTFRPGGPTLLAATGGPSFANGWAALWDVADRAHPTRLANLTLDINRTPDVFSPDGKILALPGQGFGQELGLWDVSHPSTPTRLSDERTFNASVDGRANVAFSPDGKVLATGGQDNADSSNNTVILWDLTNPSRAQQVVTLAPESGFSRQIDNMRFHPSGDLLAAARGDGNITLEDVTNRPLSVPVATLKKHAEAVGDVAFSPNGRLLASASGDGTAVIWDLGDLPSVVADPTGLACRITGGGLIRDEWQQYAPGIPYEDSCA